MHDSELIRRHTLDRARIVFVTDTLTSPTLRRNGRNLHINIFGNCEMQLCSSDDLGLYLTALSEPYSVAVHFL